MAKRQKDPLVDIASSFRFSTEILRRLGEELNPNPHQGILELVKNSYDADARSCKVEVGATVAGGEIVVTDDGVGMTPSQILDGWLVLGRSSKEPTKRTPLGRLPAGSKGLGRLAALRLGEMAHLETWPKADLTNVYSLTIDWLKFESAAIVEEIPLVVSRRSRRKDEQSRTGTKITITKLNERMGRIEIKRLARALILLADPFAKKGFGFRPELVSSDYKDLSTLVRQKYFDSARFYLQAAIDAKGRGSAQLYQDGRLIFEAEHSDLVSEGKNAPFDAPAAVFELWNFILKEDGFSGNRSVSVQSLKDWLREVGGVHIYQNGLRVSPYGDQGNDWLGMDAKRVSSPEERPSTNNSLGKFTLQDVGSLLVQKTDRSGYIENHAFEELRRFATASLNWMARRRLSLRERRRDVEKKAPVKAIEKAKKQIERAIQNSPAKEKRSILEAVGQLEKGHERETSTLRKEVQLYRTLSTAGIMAAIFSHETRGQSLKLMGLALGTLDRKLKQAMGDDYEAFARKSVDQIRASLLSLSTIGEITLGLLAGEKRRTSRTDVNDVIRTLLDQFRPYLELHKIDLTLALCSAPTLIRGSVAAVEAVAANLITNSASAFEASGTKSKRIEISTLVSGDILVFDVADSGPGLQDVSQRDIWLPGVTTRANGTGLGLTIVKDTILSLNGAVAVKSEGRLGGAQFTCRIPLIEET